MQQVAICPECSTHLALPGPGVDVDGSLAAHCPVCGDEFTLTVDRLSMLPVVQLLPKRVPPAVENPSDAELTLLAKSDDTAIAPEPELDLETSANEFAESVAAEQESETTEPVLSGDEQARSSDAADEPGGEAPAEASDVEASDKELLEKTKETLPTLAELLNRQLPTDQSSMEQSPTDQSADEQADEPVEETPASAPAAEALSPAAPIDDDSQRVEATPAEPSEVSEHEHPEQEGRVFTTGVETPRSFAEATGLLRGAQSAHHTDPEPLARDFNYDFHAAGSETPSRSTLNPVALLPPDNSDEPIRVPWVQGVLPVATGCLAGLTVGYYLLLLLGGPDRDALNVASFVPASVLPSSFHSTTISMEKPMEEKEVMAEPLPLPGELLGAESTPSVEEGDREAKFDPETKPATFNDSLSPPPLAEPKKPNSKALWAYMTSAGRIGVDPLRSVKVTAAEAALMFGGHSLEEPDYIESLGLAYANLCELAHVLSLLDADSSHPDLMIERFEAEDIYRRVFRSAHARADSRKIASRWIAWPGRPHGGVFFSGIPEPRVSSSGEGLFTYEFELEDGKLTHVVSPTMFNFRRFKGGDEMLIVGSVVESPSENIRGYVGNADRVVWLATSIKLKVPSQP